MHKQRFWIGSSFTSWKPEQIIGTTDARVACSFVFTRPFSNYTSAKFQTFAYNSRTVRSSCMKFWQQFEINELYVCTKLRGNRSRDFGFRTRKPPRKFGVKSGLSQKRLKRAFRTFLFKKFFCETTVKQFWQLFRIFSHHLWFFSAKKS